MAGIFAMATALLTPEFVENFDPEKLASKFVRVEREFGVKFNKLDSSFVIIGNWQSIREARISLLKLIADENEGNSKNQNEINEADENETVTVEITKPAKSPISSSDKNGTVKTAGNPRRGRHRKNKDNVDVPEPVFFLQYQNETYSTAESLDINSVIDEYDRSHSNKVVKKEDLKKIFEKNKDQMGKPLERGIPKGAIIPVPKTTDTANTFEPVSQLAVNDSNPGTEHLNLQFLMNSQGFTTVNSCAPVTACSTNTTLSTGHLEMTNGQFSSYHTSQSDGINNVTSLPVLSEQNMNAVTVSASMLAPVASHRIESQTFCPMFENYDPQLFINTPVSTGLLSTSLGNTSHDLPTLKNTVPTQHLDNNISKLSIFGTDHSELQLYSNNSASSRTDQQVKMELVKWREMMENTSHSQSTKPTLPVLNVPVQSNVSDNHTISSSTVNPTVLNSFNSICTMATNDSQDKSRPEFTQTGGVCIESNISKSVSQISAGSNTLSTSTSSMETANVGPVNTGEDECGQGETTLNEVINSDVTTSQQTDIMSDSGSKLPQAKITDHTIDDDRATTSNTEVVDHLQRKADKDVTPLKTNSRTVIHTNPKAKTERRKSVKDKGGKISPKTDVVKSKTKTVRKNAKNYENKSSTIHADTNVGGDVDVGGDVGGDGGDGDVGDTESDVKKSSGIVKSEKQVYKCTECDYQVYKKKRLCEHMGRVHGIMIDGKPAENSSFTCDLCEKTFVFEKDLNRHKKIVHHGQTFTCQVCFKSYKSKYVYERHLATHADGYIQPKFKCQICEREFTTKFSLSSHVKSEHLGVKKTFICPICSKTFSQMRSYRQHANVHAGIRPYTCEICGKSFTYDKSLKEHRYMHDSIRRFPCTVCGKAFRQNTCLLIHMRTHRDKRDHICSICGREFTQKQSLLRHERIHTGDKPYTCKICQRSFGDHAVIRKHVMMAHKRSKDSWKDDVLIEPKEKSTHYIEGGPGYTPREYYHTNVNIKNDTQSDNSGISTTCTESMIIDNQSESVTSGNNVCHAVTNVSMVQVKPAATISDTIEHATPSQLNNFQTLYQLPTFSQPMDLETLNSLKVKPENFIMDAANSNSIETSSSLEQFNVTGLSDQSNAISDSIFSNLVRKMSAGNDEAYAAQFLNLPGAANKIAIQHSTEQSTGINYQTTVSESATVSVGPSLSSTVAMTTTSNNSWNYAVYPSTFYTSASYNQYQPSPEN